MSDFDFDRREFAVRYRDMADGELLKLAAQSAELSDSAWEALEEELDRRNLELPEPESSFVSETPEQRNLVILERFRDLPEAMLAKGKLASQGVESYLGDDNTVRMDWLWSNLVGGVKLLVSAEDLETATRILAEPIPEEIDFEGAAEYRQPRCPKCQSLDINFEELYKPIAYGSLFVNLPIPLQRTGWICQTCRHTWQETVQDLEQGPTDSTS
ncbi:MAG TPA: hypothetical protein VHQ22_07540 [Terriglobales bacterium]|jgi:hypothetical protein|nr:hypothetical protein [Terriglobales bacterium]